jgi:SAM-dependent methyltransferase
LEDLAEFLNKPLADVRTEAMTFDNTELKKEWEKYGLDIYSKSEKYLYDLWRNIGEGTLAWIQQLLLLHEKRILDFGGGAATISLLLCKNGNEVTYYDLPGIIFDFAEFRAKKRGAKLRFVDVSTVDAIIYYPDRQDWMAGGEGRTHCLAREKAGRGREGFLPQLSSSRVRLPLVQPGRAVQMPLPCEHLRY